MKKQHLKHVVEKARSQTKTQAMRVVDRLSGLRSGLLDEKNPEKQTRQKRLRAESGKEGKEKAKDC